MAAILIARAEASAYRVVEANASFDSDVVGANLFDVLDARVGLGPLRETILDAIDSADACNAHLRSAAGPQPIERQMIVVPINPYPRTIRATIADHTVTGADMPPLETIVNAISHEFRSPLNAALIWASLLEMDSAPATAQKAATIIRESVMKQTRLIDDLIDVSRGAAQADPTAMESIDLSALIVGVVEDVRVSLPPSINLDVQIEREPLTASGDRTRLDRALRHLIGNAAAALRESDGNINIELTCNADDALVTVSDTGQGMTADEIASTFRPFWRPDRRFSGAGLGLAAVRTLVALHGGSVCARSGGLGLGAAFTFSLPLQRDAHPLFTTVALR